MTAAVPASTQREVGIIYYSVSIVKTLYDYGGRRLTYARIPWHFRAAWLRLKQTDLIPGKGQFR